MSERTTLTRGEMFAFVFGATVDREERPRSAEDLVGQTWRQCEDGWELVETHNDSEEKED